jgi:hypothetical protein
MLNAAQGLREALYMSTIAGHGDTYLRSSSPDEGLGTPVQPGTESSAARRFRSKGSLLFQSRLIRRVEMSCCCVPQGPQIEVCSHPSSIRLVTPGRVPSADDTRDSPNIVLCWSVLPFRGTRSASCLPIAVWEDCKKTIQAASIMPSH